MLDHSGKEHSENGLYFNRDFERNEIKNLTLEQAKKYLDDSLEDWIQRNKNEMDQEMEL